ncbi:hypothetical protein J2S43_005162 [Catenuloplanes nepalensis]|uniref:Peptidase MA-like domain-containing protein n=1 Tax=Catenuloplanes nepalensis TaxID=587533 RepID=A0ABT9MZ62_9ACTN|nr:hypothetical protein [Catenuloplanes nepalensis]MDP9796650.1 hypothetical protein [Catenuloplanes nepalensis]
MDLPGAGRAPLRRRPLVLAPLLVVAVATALVAALAVAYPAVAALACPRCYNLAETQPRVYVERGATDAQRTTVATVMSAADATIRGFYGDRVSTPRVLACVTDECYQRLHGGGSKGIAILNRGLMLSPDGLNPVIATHELAHVELHTRLGSATVPQWFDEGLAVVISDDARYLAPPGSATRCLMPLAEALPLTTRDWNLDTAAADNAYAKAACLVSHWLTTAGGPAALHPLITALRAGTPFSTLVTITP